MQNRPNTSGVVSSDQPQPGEQDDSSRQKIQTASRQKRSVRLHADDQTQQQQHEGASISKDQQSHVHTGMSQEESYPHEEERAYDYIAPPERPDSEEIGPIFAQQVEMFSNNNSGMNNETVEHQISDHDSILEDQEDQLIINPKLPAQHDRKVISELERLIINLNHTAMQFMRGNQFDVATALLVKAEQNLLQVDNQISQIQESIGQDSLNEAVNVNLLNALKNKLLGLTYNNLGCVAKQKKEHQEALTYLKKALIYESAQEEQYLKLREIEASKSIGSKEPSESEKLLYEQYISCNTSGTILNICAILSKIGKHKQAYTYAIQAIQNLKKSLDLMQKEIAKIQIKRTQRDYAGQSQALDRRESELQQNWFNIATTTVIAYYNAAVESEFTCQWQEALDLYNEALYLSERSMRSQNSLTPKIQHAITKVSMKVRNQVQLPKLRPKKVLARSTFRTPQDESKFTAKPSQQTASVGQKSQNTKVSGNQSSRLPGNINIVNGSQMRSTEIPSFQSKVLQDPKVSSGEAKIAQIQDSLMSDGEHILEPDVEGTINTAKQISVGDPINSETINIKQLSMFDSKKLNFVENPSLLQGDSLKKRSHLNSKHSKPSGRKSPLSIRQIINRLEKQQMSELSEENQVHFYRNNRTIQTVHIGQERSMISNQTLNSTKNEWTAKLKSSQFVNTRRQSQQPRFASEEADEQEEASMLPQIGMPPNSAGHTEGLRLFSTKDDRIRTQVGTAGVGMVGQSYLSQRQTQTNYNKKRTKVPIRSGWMKDSYNKDNSNRRSELPSKMTTSIETHPIKDGFDTRGQNFELSGAQELTSNRESEFSKAFATTRGGYFKMDKRVLTPRSSNNFRVSPVSLQLLLNKEQEQRQKYIELKSMEAQSRHDREVKYFADHIKKQSQKNQNRDLVSSDDEHKSNFRKEYEKITKKISSAVYLPEKLKKGIKRQQLQKQLQDAIKLRDELQEHQQAMRINQQMQEVFQKEMEKWKIEQEQIMDNKLKSLEQERQQKETDQLGQLNARHSIKEEQARQEIERLKEYTKMVEAARQEAQCLLIAQQEEKATQELRRAAAVDVSTSTLVKEIKSNATLTVQVDRMDQNTSIQSFRDSVPIKFDMNTSVEGLAPDRVDKQVSAMSLPKHEPVKRVDQITSTEGLEPAAIARRATQMSLVSSMQSQALHVTDMTRQIGNNSHDFILVENSIIRLSSHASGGNQQLSEIPMVEDQREQKSSVRLSSRASGNDFPQSEIPQIEDQHQQKSSVKLSSLASRGNNPMSQIPQIEDQQQQRSSVKPSSHASRDNHPLSEISFTKEQQQQKSSVRLSSHASGDNHPLSEIPYIEDQQQQQSSALQSEQGQSSQEDVQVQSRVETVTSSRNESVVVPLPDLTTNQIELKHVSTSSPKHYIRYSQDHSDINQESKQSNSNDQSYAVRTMVQSKQERVMRSSQAISEMIAKVNPQMEESNYMDESDYQKTMPKVTQFVPRPIPKVAQSSDKRTITDSTLNQHSEQQYEINMFGEISIIGEEEIANWQIQANKFGAQEEINEIDVEESVVETDQQTEKVNAFIGEGPIFIQRKTSYRTRDDESKNSTKTVIKKGQASTRIRLELEHDFYPYGIHELATRPTVERTKTSTQVNHEIYRIKQHSVKSGVQTIKHETTKRPFNKSIERVQAKGISVKHSYQIKAAIRESSDSQTNGTEKVGSGKHDAVLALLKDVDLRTDDSEMTEKPKNAQLNQLYHQIDKSQSSCYTNVKPILQSNITKPQPKIKSQFKKSIPNNEYCLNVAIKPVPQPEPINDKRFARISDHIQKLNLQLEQFQVDLEQQMNDPLLQSSRRSDYVQAAKESLKDTTPAAKRGLANTHASELTVVPQRKDFFNTTEKQMKASQLTKSTLPKNIHQSHMQEQRELASEQTEGILVEDVISADNNHSQATQRTNVQLVPMARNQL